MSDQDSGSEDFSGLSGFFFYVFIVHPCTAWILRPGRFERKRSIMYAIAFLAALAAIKTGEWIDREELNVGKGVDFVWVPKSIMVVPLDKLHV